MKTGTVAPSSKGFRFPQEGIAHAIWHYHRFNRSFAQAASDVEELLFAQGMHVTYETVRQWCRRFGQTFTDQ